MCSHPLGWTDLHVSPVGLGTVALGLDYGLRPDGRSNRLTQAAVEALLATARDLGINFLDTAHDYGNSEALLGEILDSSWEGLYVATKCRQLDTDAPDLAGQIRRSVEVSLQRLRCEKLDVFQLHNPSVRLLASEEVRGALVDLKAAGVLGAIGVAGYGTDLMLTAIECGWVDVLQLSLNLLDQRMLIRAIPAARAAGIAIIARSVFLKGVLSAKRAWLPARLAPLRRAADRCERWAAAQKYSLPEAALRFALSIPGVSTALIGATKVEHIRQAAHWAQEPMLAAEVLAAARRLALGDLELLDPRAWDIAEEEVKSRVDDAAASPPQKMEH